MFGLLRGFRWDGTTLEAGQKCPSGYWSSYLVRSRSGIWPWIGSGPRVGSGIRSWIGSRVGSGSGIRPWVGARCGTPSSIQRGAELPVNYLIERRPGVIGGNR